MILAKPSDAMHWGRVMKVQEQPQPKLKPGLQIGAGVTIEQALFADVSKVHQLDFSPA